MPRLFLLIACLSLGAGNLIFAQDAKILVAKLRERLSSIQSIDVAYTIKQEKERIILSQSGKLWTAQEHWIFDQGRERLEFENDSVASFWVFDGKRSISPSSFEKNKEILGATIRSGLTENSKGVWYPVILGMRSQYTMKSIAELLQHPSARKLPDEEIGEIMCPVMTATEPIRKGTLTTTVAFDPKHDYAPIRIHYMVPDQKGTKKEYLPDDTYLITEWGTFDDHIPMPSAAKYYSPIGDVSITVNSLLTKIDPGPETFAVELPDGVNVVEIAPNGEKRSYMTGGAEAVRNRLEEIRKATELAMKNGVVHDARPRGTSLYWLWWISIGAGVIAIGVYLYRVKVQ